MKLNQLDCFKATVAHKKHDGFLWYASFTPESDKTVREYYGLNPETSISEHFGMYTPVDVDMLPPADLKTPDFSGYYKDIKMPDNAGIDGTFGMMVIPGSSHHFIRYINPLRNATKFEEIESFPYPSIAGYTSSHMAGQVAKAHEQNKVTRCILCHMFSDAWLFRGYENFLVDMYEHPEWCELMLDKIVERNLTKAVAAANAGVDYILTGDDFADQRSLLFSIETWRKFMKPRWAKVYAAAKKIKPDIQVFFHSDGNIEEIIPELIEIGVTILNPIQPECMNPAELKKKFGDKLVFEGAIGTQTTMPFDTSANVKKIVKELINTVGSDGAFIVCPSHTLEPEVPIANIDAFIKTMQEYGTFE
jgi:uroporphyrinogen decarboxylase